MGDLLQQQIAYYQARAGEYDQWFLRQGRYDRGEELNQQWFAEVVAVRQALADFNPGGAVLELACGTGLWTEQLAATARTITAVDAAAEVLQLNRERLQSDKIDYIRADLFSWQPAQRYDVVFFSFWLSHVPAERFWAFWQMVEKSLQPHGRVFFIDSLYTPISTAVDHHLPGAETKVVTRRLNDGRQFDIVKIFYQPTHLEAQLQAAGWEIAVKQTDQFFLYGAGQRI